MGTLIFGWGKRTKSSLQNNKKLYGQKSWTYELLEIGKNSFQQINFSLLQGNSLPLNSKWLLVILLGWESMEDMCTDYVTENGRGTHSIGKQYAKYPCAPVFYGMDKQWRKVRMQFFRPATWLWFLIKDTFDVTENGFFSLNL